MIHGIIQQIHDLITNYCKTLYNYYFLRLKTTATTISNSKRRKDHERHERGDKGKLCEQRYLKQ